MANREATYGTKDKTVKVPKEKTHNRNELQGETNYNIGFIDDNDGDDGDGNGDDNDDDGEDGNSDDNGDDGDLDNFHVDTPSTSARTHKRVVKTGTTNFLKPDFLDCPLIQSVAIRNKINPTSLSNIMRALIESCNGDASAVNTSYSQTAKYMQESSKKICDLIHKDWVKPTKAFLHWDGKIMDSLDKAENEERLPVLVSGVGGVKLLGVPSKQSLL